MVGPLDLPGGWPRRWGSLITLKALTTRRRAGFVAAPDSLPEFSGGVRNWTIVLLVADAVFTLDAS